ncbi:MAG: hypothetical protein O4861_07335 [Trichodesmium sp. St16_bin4-tuft]|nr:hypothetical protein [Trichodesmium sp. St5_bin8]MDE5098157.1 hypothetical protein [Trichodesmium sp. St16_bin4-tuft]MDE5104803.1 hypothetical protein [Trichodesmium sp. St19_bin2]
MPNLTFNIRTSINFSQFRTPYLAISGILIPIVTGLGTMRSRSNLQSRHKGDPIFSYPVMQGNINTC